MMVTFVSECEKKSLHKTRRVLDAFANRIGSRTWQTVITQQGLDAVKKLLRQTATKNTAVSCHWIRSRSRSELVWMVGNRSKFNYEGYVPVNRTQQDFMNIEWENDWQGLQLIKSLAAMSALFHDWGKSSELFQTKLNPELRAINPTPKGDPIRHEWISVLFLEAFIQGESDLEWLERLQQGKFDKERLIQRVKENIKNPLENLPPLASSVAWLILSHHRLPLYNKGREDCYTEYQELMEEFSSQWGYQNKFDEKDFKKHFPRCFNFEQLPSDSARWLVQVKKWANKLLPELTLLDEVIKTNAWRLILHYVRLSLMLGDHNFSSQYKNPLYKAELKLYANTFRDKDEKLKPKQSLDEHLLGVTKAAVSIAHLLPMFESNYAELERVYDIKALKQASPHAFQWQDKAVKKINVWRENRRQSNHNINEEQFGFFTVNMASTGKGKTFANAKIMRALSPKEDSLRFILALGLRTLTLQTGDEYRHKIKLSTDDLAVLIGSSAILELHQQKSESSQQEQELAKEQELSNEKMYGDSASAQPLLESGLIYDGSIPEGQLTTILTSKKTRQFLYAPVLACTIDHLMSATETKRGGRYILPSLRLMSSDLVIDEIDDFDGEDAIAIGRLIHLAGMLGRKVMISSATISPDIAMGYFNAYQAGWKIFAKLRQRSEQIGCAWVDEFNTQVETISLQKDMQEYQKNHDVFIQKRIQKLAQEHIKRRAIVFSCEYRSDLSASAEQQYFKHMFQAIVDSHQDQAMDYGVHKQKVSFGVVRVANIAPCVEFTRYLLSCDLPEDTEIKTMSYHSQQVLLMRNAQEQHLDSVLQRNKALGEQAPFENPVIRQHLKQSSAKNIIFILVATPVEEVGRDHDFDWAVIEPSSYRSIIQLSGRVLRHRAELTNQQANIRIMQYNLKGFQALSKAKKNHPVFNYPGYETKRHLLTTHDLTKLINSQQVKERLDASPRIYKPEKLEPKQQLADLEHFVMHKALTNYSELGAQYLQGWLEGYWWLTANPQLFIQFRRSAPQKILYLLPNEKKDSFVFHEKTEEGFIPTEQLNRIEWAEPLTDKQLVRLWLKRDYQNLLDKSPRASAEYAAQYYGEISIPQYSDNQQWQYCQQLGLTKKQ